MPTDASAPSPMVRRARVATLVAGLTVLALAAVSMAGGRPDTCGGLPERYPPIIAFELARTGADLHAIFGDPGPCRDGIVAALDRVNHLDLALFIPAYGAFLVAWFLGLGDGRTRLVRAGVALAVLAMVGDVLENACLLGLTPDLDPTSSWLALLPFATAIKWLALGAVGLVAALVLVTRAWPRQLAAAVCTLAAIDTAMAMADPSAFGPTVALGVGASWLVMLVTGGLRLRRPG